MILSGYNGDIGYTIRGKIVNAVLYFFAFFGGHPVTGTLPVTSQLRYTVYVTTKEVYVGDFNDLFRPVSSLKVGVMGT